MPIDNLNRGSEMKLKTRVCAGLVFAFAVALSGCNQGAEQKKEGPTTSESSVKEGQPPSALAGIKKEVKETTEKVVEKVEETTEKVAENIEEKTDQAVGMIAKLANSGALLVPIETDGGPENNEGVGHYKEGHWEVSEKHFRKALEANSELPEAHYNLALTLDKLDKHQEATNHFETALDLDPDNPKIRDSEILQDHVGGS